MFDTSLLVRRIVDLERRGEHSILFLLFITLTILTTETSVIFVYVQRVGSGTGKHSCIYGTRCTGSLLFRSVTIILGMLVSNSCA